ncbi:MULTISPECIES: pyridoxal-phosphate dependent enzyme [unclassified Lysobacter]|uniref:pyridoxal-phosphate dependent enzyme n=1 Tax=unclassified Lysobacter TaxID=2635362 RepID=UPI0006FDB91F|nr:MULTISPECIES: pyridoxal-phosphate dependent enzyme [unclassified Lysobacter]KRC33624.1 hypothetical protein ASE10_11680 [Lysobacter sp. Root76]KRD68961.1 hypothetical protein ASE45_07130 [Lysobacter sp. Root96]
MNTDARTVHWNIAELWDDYRPTPLIALPALARRAGVAQVLVKCEGERPLGNFKALGGLYAGLRALARAIGADSLRELEDRRHQVRALRLVCASDGNHGLAVAAAAARAGASASVYLPSEVDAARARRIARLGAEVVRIYGTYDDAVDAAAGAASRGDGLLIADTSDEPDDPVVADVMAGYGLLLHELHEQLNEHGDGRISHAFVQAGVGGLAAAVAEGLHQRLPGPGRLLVVEPADAACVALALSEGRPLRVPGELHTSAEMLSCGLASAPAVAILKRHGAASIVVDEAQLLAAPGTLRDADGPQTTPSGAAGVAGLLRCAEDPALRSAHALTEDSRVLLIATERPPA